MPFEEEGEVAASEDLPALSHLFFVHLRRLHFSSLECQNVPHGCKMIQGELNVNLEDVFRHLLEDAEERRATPKRIGKFEFFASPLLFHCLSGAILKTLSELRSKMRHFLVHLAGSRPKVVTSHLRRGDTPASTPAMATFSNARRRST